MSDDVPRLPRLDDHVARTRFCLRCGEQMEPSPSPRVVKSVHETPEECVRLLRAVVDEALEYTTAAKNAAPDRYKWIGRPLPEIVEAIADRLEELELVEEAVGDDSRLVDESRLLYASDRAPAWRPVLLVGGARRAVVYRHGVWAVSAGAA